MVNWHNPVGCDNHAYSPIDFAARLRRHAAPIEHDPEKWKPVFHATNAMRLRADHAQTKRLDHDAIPLDRIMI
jgi:hypothetical protein